jgi:hypothetical protein
MLAERSDRGQGDSGIGRAGASAESWRPGTSREGKGGARGRRAGPARGTRRPRTRRGAGHMPRPRVTLASAEPRRVFGRSRTRRAASRPGQSPGQSMGRPRENELEAGNVVRRIGSNAVSTTGCPMMRISRWFLPLSGVPGQVQGLWSTPRGVQLRSPGVSTRLAKHAGPPPAWTSLILSVSQGAHVVNTTCRDLSSRSEGGSRRPPLRPAPPRRRP